MARMQRPWIKMGKAHQTSDGASTLYIRKIGYQYTLISENKNPLPDQSRWMTLGKYRTLREAKIQGDLLMWGGEPGEFLTGY